MTKLDLVAALDEAQDEREAETQRVIADLVSNGYTVSSIGRVASTDGTAEQGIVGCDIRAVRDRE